MRLCLAVALAALFALPSWAQPTLPLLDASRLPTSAAARGAYQNGFLLGQLPRAFALASNGAYGWASRPKAPVDAKTQALEACRSKGGADCRLYAVDLHVVWPGQESAPPSPPPQAVLLGAADRYAFDTDPNYIWWGPQAARGIVVWGHGLSADRTDERGQQPQPYLRALNNAGYDVIRFDRAPEWDGNSRLDAVVEFLRDGLGQLRAQGWKSVIAAGQSRGGINSLMLLHSPGVADAILAVSPALAGTDPGQVAMRGEVQFYKMLSDVPKQGTRVMFTQFQGDPFAGNEDKRVERLHEMLVPQIGPFLLIDRPSGITGHGGGNTAGFAERFAQCIRHFVMDATPPATCPDNGG